MAMHDIAGVVNVERDGCGLARIAIHPCVDQGVGQADYVAQSRRILQPRQRRLGTQIPARIRQATAGELERWIGPQMIEVVSVLVAAADREHASAEHVDKACTTRVGSRRSGNTRAKLSAKPRRRSAIARSITPPFEVRRPPSKAAVTFLA